MPKIKDLGVKVIPETMLPPEMGPGGGAPCQIGPTCGCTAQTCGGFSRLGCTNSPVSICGGCSIQVTFHCQPSVCQPTVCHPTVTVCHPTNVCDPTFMMCQPTNEHPTFICQLMWGPSPIGTVCACSQIASIPCGGSGCGAISPVCGGSIIDPG